MRSYFGVFPEHGFAGDDMYPKFYDDGSSDHQLNVGCPNLNQTVIKNNAHRCPLQAIALSSNSSKFGEIVFFQYSFI